jgi:hypothetical protein
MWLLGLTVTYDKCLPLLSDRGTISPAVFCMRLAEKWHNRGTLTGTVPVCNARQQSLDMERPQA